MSHLTKDQILDALEAHGMEPLPPASARKDELVAVYKEVVTGGNTGMFSSDDEEAASSSSGSPRKRASQTSTKRKSVSRTGETMDAYGVVVNGEDLSELSDDQLFHRLKEFNADVGPIVESTRSLYQKKLANLMRGDGLENGQNGSGQNGSGSKKTSRSGVRRKSASRSGLDLFSADEEDEDGQPAPVVTSAKVKAQPAKSPRSPRKSSIAEAATSLRQRFADMDSQLNTSSSPGGRFTPTPRRSIHSYKVTETTKHTKVKTPDGNVSHDYSFTRQQEEDGDDVEGALAKGRIQRMILHNMPKLFILILFLAVAYFTLRAEHFDVSHHISSIQGFFKSSQESILGQTNEESSPPPPAREPLDEQPSIANV